MTDPIEHVATAADVGVRLDVLVARLAATSRAVAVRVIAEGGVRVNGEPAMKSLRVEEGMRIVVDARDVQAPPGGEDIPLRVVFEDEHLVVISKPAGLVVHPAPGHRGGTVVNALLAREEEGVPAGGDDEDRPGIVHRLDAGTSGLMVVAKNESAHERLVAMMSAREVVRVYRALAQGSPDSETATVDAPIGRSPRHRKQMAVVAGGRDAVTNLEVLERHTQTSLLEVRPRTGRTHQIRVHLAAIGHPIVGDRVYGGRRALAASLGLERPFLHAAELSFRHPVTSEMLKLDDPLPQDLVDALQRARELA